MQPRACESNEAVVKVVKVVKIVKEVT